MARVRLPSHWHVHTGRHTQGASQQGIEDPRSRGLRTYAGGHDGGQRLDDARHGGHDAEDVQLAAGHPHHEGQQPDALERARRLAHQRLRACSES